MSRLFFARDLTNRYAASPDRIEPLDTIVGTPGNDTLTGTAGNDTINGGAGADLMSGGTGNDRYEVDNAGDKVVETPGSGYDIVYSSVNYQLSANVEVLTLTGTARLGSGNGLANHLNGNELGNGLQGGEGGDNIQGNGGNDTLRGDAGSDVLNGGTGNDGLQGGDDNDVLNGGLDNDSLDGGQGNDNLFGDLGNDSILGGSGDDYISCDALFGDTLGGSDTCDGGDGVDEFFGTYYNWTESVEFTASTATDTLYNDTLTGFERFYITFGTGNDTVTAATFGEFNGGIGDDVMRSVYDDAVHFNGEDGNDTLIGFTGNDFLSGFFGDDLLEGGEGNDTLLGGGGSDTLLGGAGKDRLLVLYDAPTTMTGGAGKDVFQLGTATGSVVVTDFENKEKFLFYGASIGDADKVVDGATTVAGPGGYAADAELVVVTDSISGEITAASAAAAIGAATDAYAVGRSALFVVNNGVDTAVLRFESAGHDADVSASELNLIVTLIGVDSTTTSNYELAV